MREASTNQTGDFNLELSCEYGAQSVFSIHVVNKNTFLITPCFAPENSQCLSEEGEQAALHG